jgi:hypothetical protein
VVRRAQALLMMADGVPGTDLGFGLELPERIPRRQALDLLWRLLSARDHRVDARQDVGVLECAIVVRFMADIRRFELGANVPRVRGLSCTVSRTDDS